MKKILILTSCLLLAAQMARADHNLIFTPTSSPNVLPGGQVSFDVSVFVSSANSGPAEVLSITLLFETIAANSTYFNIVSADHTGSPFDSVTTADPSGDIVPGGNEFDLGATASPGLLSDADGETYFVLTLTISVAGTTPGSPGGTPYTIDTTTFASGPGPYSGGGDRPSNVANATDEFFFDATSFTINVVPEPTTWSLIALGGLGAFGLNLLRARRKS